MARTNKPMLTSVDDFRFWVPLISDSIKAGALEQATRRMATTGSSLQEFLQWCIPGDIAQTRLRHLNYSREKILKRMEQKNSDHRDFLYYVMKQQDKGDLNKNEVIVNGALFIIAGTETTAGFLTGLFNLLTRPENKHILDMLTKEIRENFRSDKDISFQALVTLPYLSAVIDEGLRIFPSAPIGFTRSVPQGGDTVCGEYLPGGTTVSVCMWAATHSERNFVDPYVFRPERWFDRENDTDKLGASNAFSLGPRGCIGKHLSYMEMRLIIGKLLWHNDVSMPDLEVNRAWNPKGDYERMKVYTNWIKPGLKLKLTPRKD
jgi:cytochrome P450